MLLKITCTHSPATDLGYLLHKHPDKFQTVDLSVGKAHVFYPEATAERTTACLALELDPVEMVRSGKHMDGEGFSLRQYVNDRPYVASSFMSVAIAKVFGSALNGKCNDRPELLVLAMPLEVTLPVLPAPKGGEGLIRRFFEPLGYVVDVDRLPLDDRFPEWGSSRYYAIRLAHTVTVQQLLSHLYVLIPALDNDKHYFISENEIEKLLQKGEGWLQAHPEREQITRRYLSNLGGLSRKALDRLRAEDGYEEEGDSGMPQEVVERRLSLHDKRIQAVAARLKAAGAQSVLDLGCGEAKLIRELLKDGQFTKIAGMDVSYGELLKAKERLHWDEMSPKQRERLNLFHGSLLYRDARFAGYEAAAVVEVIEHLEMDRLRAFERVVFEFAQPRTVVLTTPNKEYNTVFENMDVGDMRHDDHRFEWTRAEFAAWAARVGQQHGYKVEIAGIGEEVDPVGAPSQMAIFTYGNQGS